MSKAWDDHFERGRAEGYAEGRAEGYAESRAEGYAESQREVLISLVNDGLLALSEAARRANLSETEFQAMLKQASTKI